MKEISIEQFTSQPQSVVDASQHEQLLITRDGEPLAVVVDHIIPRCSGGQTEFENLCFSCHRCNELKCDAISGEDPITGDS